MPIYYFGGHMPSIHLQTWIAPNANIIGHVRLEKNVSVWWNCTLRGDIELISIGENTNVQDGTVLHTDPGLRVLIGRDVTIGHCAILHGCTVGDGCLIGMGATLLNRSVIGKQCLIGANALIPEGKVIPDRSLVVGAPGRIVRQLTDDEVAHIAAGAKEYVENWKRYVLELEKVPG
ncbi:MAG: gamma carbonic anhydrase family protein [Candidatus Accumulibacter sp.]|jgi:carbonic anhydrase/acetyltransferase-like protein (isoleucine patch superfamily)|nr:gamma carbonic anhydrase family protein [Accumulibacter sp.]